MNLARVEPALGGIKNHSQFVSPQATERNEDPKDEMSENRRLARVVRAFWHARVCEYEIMRTRLMKQIKDERN